MSTGGCVDPAAILAAYRRLLAWSGGPGSVGYDSVACRRAIEMLEVAGEVNAARGAFGDIHQELERQTAEKEAAEAGAPDAAAVMRPSPSQLRDPEVLKKVDLERLCIKLKAQGWAVIPDGIGSTWIGFGADIRLPLSESSDDYAARVSDALRTLERVEDRWAADIYVDLLP